MRICKSYFSITAISSSIVQNAEGILWLEMSQSENQVDRDPAHLLRHPHS